MNSASLGSYFEELRELRTEKYWGVNLNVVMAATSK